MQDLEELLKDWLKRLQTKYEVRDALAQGWEKITPHPHTAIHSFDPRRHVLTISILPSSCLHTEIHFQKKNLLEALNLLLANHGHEPVRELIFKPLLFLEEK
ncbi:MAG: hypothetical protein SFT81_03635 [Candidatus Caenarcaniphilales bacterium]|nr:hypothetical protein [Candidatus Caenarcaniphilales bacterium]